MCYVVHIRKMETIHSYYNCAKIYVQYVGT